MTIAKKNGIITIINSYYTIFRRVVKQFEIPYNFDKELIEHLTMLNIKKLIHSIYLPPFKEDYISAKHYYTSSKRQHNVYNTLPDNRIEYESHI